jgi:hypothetical protein
MFAHGVHQPVAILALRQYLDVGMISHCTAQSRQREGLIVRKYNLNIAHKPPQQLRNAYPESEQSGPWPDMAFSVCDVSGAYRVKVNGVKANAASRKR